MNKSLWAAALLTTALPFASQAAVSVSIDIAPPPLPVYAQPLIPAPGYIWTPGYWRWNPDDGDYFWVPGTWIAPPYVGALWTPGYWAWGGGGYRWHGGYWGNRIGFYGGVNYGYGYGGHGYLGGRWDGGVFSYNRSVNNINTTIVHNVYNTTVVENNARVSFNGGHGGIAARPTDEERQARAEPHSPPTQLQRRHEQVAMHTPEQRVSMNHGNPGFAAAPQPHDFRQEGGGPPPHPHRQAEHGHPQMAEQGHRGHAGGNRPEHREGGQPH